MHALSADDLAALNPRCEYSPPGFSQLAAMSQARSLFQSVRGKFPQTQLDDQVQDATYHAGISVLQGEIRLSNFGRLATITSEERFPSDTLAQLVALIEQAGYAYVSFRIFGEPFLTRQRFTRDLFTSLFDYV